MSSHHQLKTALMILLGLALLITFTTAAASSETQASTCARELENANRSLTDFGQRLEGMVNESELPTTIRGAIHKEANLILDLIEDFGDKIRSRPSVESARDLVSIRRRANRMALDIYLNTFDMRWPQNSLQLGVIVERAQQACLSRDVIQALESPTNPLDSLLNRRT